MSGQGWPLDNDKVTQGELGAFCQQHTFWTVPKSPLLLFPFIYIYTGRLSVRCVKGKNLSRSLIPLIHHNFFTTRYPKGEGRLISVDKRFLKFPTAKSFNAFLEYHQAKIVSLIFTKMNEISSNKISSVWNFRLPYLYCR